MASKEKREPVSEYGCDLHMTHPFENNVSPNAAREYHECAEFYRAALKTARECIADERREQQTLREKLQGAYKRVERLEKDEDSLIARLREVVGLALGDMGPLPDEFALGDEVDAVNELQAKLTAKEVECEAVREALNGAERALGNGEGLPSGRKDTYPERAWCALDILRAALSSTDSKGGSDA